MMMRTMSKILVPTVALLLLAVGPSAGANDFSDRGALTDQLGAGDQAAVADAEQALPHANASLPPAQQRRADAQTPLASARQAQTAADTALTAAQHAKTDADAALASAQQALAAGQATMPPLTADQIAALQAAVTNATTARDTAAANL